MNDADDTSTPSPRRAAAPPIGVFGTQALLLAGASLLTTGLSTGSRRSAPNTEPEAGFGPDEAERPDGGGGAVALAPPEGDADAAATSDGAIGPAAVPTDDPRVAGAVTTTEADPAQGGTDGKEPRRRRRARAPEEDGEDADAAGLGPLVRHLSALTKELSEAQRTVGRLSAERDLLRRQLGELAPNPLLLVDGQNDGIRPAKEARLEAKAAKQAERAAIEEPVPTPEELATRAEAAGRRRRLIALGLVVALAATFWLGRLMHVPIGDYMSKGGLPAIPYIGPIFQVLLAGFLIFRVVRIGGKAGNWLFPSPEEPKRRRR